MDSGILLFMWSFGSLMKETHHDQGCRSSRYHQHRGQTALSCATDGMESKIILGKRGTCFPKQDLPSSVHSKESETCGQVLSRAACYNKEEASSSIASWASCFTNRVPSSASILRPSWHPPTPFRWVCTAPPEQASRASCPRVAVGIIL